METTDEFMARFRATGLDMLCEARRRAEQSIPFYISDCVTGRTSGKHPELHRSVRKNALFGFAYYDPEALGLNTFPTLGLDLDLNKIEDRVMSLYPYQREVIDKMFEGRPMEFISGRRAGHRSLMLAAAALTINSRTFGNWDFHEPVPDQHNLPERQLWPGVKAQVEGERRYDAKRIAKARLKKKQAAKSKPKGKK